MNLGPIMYTRLVGRRARDNRWDGTNRETIYLIYLELGCAGAYGVGLRPPSRLVHLSVAYRYGQPDACVDVAGTGAQGDRVCLFVFSLLHKHARVLGWRHGTNM